jgi:excisionase family DNA binding protein
MPNEPTPVSPTLSPQFYSLAEVALILGVNKRMVMDWVRQGRLPIFRLGPTHRIIRIRKSDLEQFIEAHTHTHASMTEA